MQTIPSAREVRAEHVLRFHPIDREKSVPSIIILLFKKTQEIYDQIRWVVYRKVPVAYADPIHQNRKKRHQPTLLFSHG